MCAREIARRRVDVDLGVARSSPARTSPPSTRRPVHDQAGDRLLHVADLDDGAVGELDQAVVGQLAAALGVERGAVEDELDLVALAGATSTGSPSTSRPRDRRLARRPRRSR